MSIFSRYHRLSGENGCKSTTFPETDKIFSGIFLKKILNTRTLTALQKKNFSPQNGVWSEKGD